MTTETVEKYAGVKELLSIIIPTYTHSLLVPNVAIAEIMNIGNLNCSNDGSGWSFGIFDWRGQQLPLVSFDHFRDPHLTIDLGQEHRIAIMNSVVSHSLPAYALLCNGIPKLVRLLARDLSESMETDSVAENIRLKFAGEETIIPKLEYIEHLVAGNV